MAAAVSSGTPTGPRSLEALRAHLAAYPIKDRPDAAVYVYHAHVHFSLDGEEPFETASAFKERLQERFPSSEHYFFGRTHRKPVGPHPVGSYELVFTRPDYADVVNFLTFNRPSSLSIFIHPHTFQSLEDHMDRALWLGKPNELVPTVLLNSEERYSKEMEQGKDEAQVLWDHHT
ncbi:hypothetical protein WJX73_000532 [Symbiochloris irregularis]|uniref:DOPA 4,5-dioxygenase n=1 Tax=Symbiochloris irregularis TaxID=706552 RepID=A0AAW1NU50_9CHLO